MPNAGFLEDVVFEDPAFLYTYEASGSCEGDDSMEKVNSIDNKGAADAVEVEATSSSSGHAPKIQFHVTNEETEQLADDMVELKVIENVSTDELKADDQHPLSAEDIDLLLDKCLLQALHTTVKEKDLPMPGSTLWYDLVRLSKFPI